MTPACGRFNSLDENFDQAAVSDVTHVENKMPPQRHQQQQQQQLKQTMDSSSNGGK